MPRKLTARSRVCLLGLLACNGFLLTGCASDRNLSPGSDASRIAQRPTYAVEGTRPLYLGGYAGADYDRGTRPSR